MDEKNKELHGCLSFEKYLIKKYWNQRNSGFVVCTAPANSHVAYEYFLNKSNDGKKNPKSEFDWKVVQGLMEFLNEGKKMEKTRLYDISTLYDVSSGNVTTHPLKMK